MSGTGPQQMNTSAGWRNGASDVRADSTMAAVGEVHGATSVAYEIDSQPWP